MAREQEIPLRVKDLTKEAIDALGINAATLEGLTVAQIQTAVSAAIVDAAPGTLDTLNELAAALGDDANFATTITTALAGKAALAHTHPFTDITGTASDAQIPSTITRDTELTDAIALHEADTSVHGIANTADLLLIGQAVGLRLVTGFWYGGSGANTSVAPGNGIARYSPLFVPVTTTVDRIGIEVVTAGTTGTSKVRLGIYSDSNGLPGALVLDAGQANADVTGSREITINQSLARGIYWLVAVPQGSPATEPVLRAMSGWSPFIGTSSGSGAATGYTQSGVTGALPANASPGTSAGTTPRAVVRAA